MKYFLWLPLFFYGFFYHISSSEFWPVTVSRGWFFEQLEASQLQKPLFSFFLGLLHLLPIGDAVHVYTARAIFCALGVLTLALFSRLISQILSFKYLQFDWIFSLVLLLLSPTLLNNFFNIRSDQAALLLFVLFLSQVKNKQPVLAFISLLIIPLLGVKEVVFFIPALLIYANEFSKRLTRKQLWFLATTIFAVLLWLAALNITAIFYFFETSKNAVSFKILTDTYLQYEFIPFLVSIGIAIYDLIKNGLRTFSALALYFSFIVLTIPQAFPFLIASFVPFIYLPLLLKTVQAKGTTKISYLGLCLVQLGLVLWNYSSERLKLYESNLAQFKFIETTSGLIQKRNFTYLDGMGIFPKQNFIPCFVSPDDPASNANCIDNLTKAKPEIIIITQRLNNLGPLIFSEIEKNYTQIRPNIWLQTTKLNSETNSIVINTTADQPLPQFIF